MPEHGHNKVTWEDFMLAPLQLDPQDPMTWAPGVELILHKVDMIVVSTQTHVVEDEVEVGLESSVTRTLVAEDGGEVAGVAEATGAEWVMGMAEVVVMARPRRRHGMTRIMIFY
jgi:hypothetical protein